MSVDPCLVLGQQHALMGSDWAATPVAAGGRGRCRQLVLFLEDGRHSLGEAVCTHAASPSRSSLRGSDIAAAPAAALWESGVGYTGDGRRDTGLGVTPAGCPASEPASTLVNCPVMGKQPGVGLEIGACGILLAAGRCLLHRLDSSDWLASTSNHRLYERV